MTIIDQYIADHYDEPLEELSIALGISISYVCKKREKIQPPTKHTKRTRDSWEWIDNEPLALVQLITERKTGWAVDMAKERLKEIQKQR